MRKIVLYSFIIVSLFVAVGCASVKSATDDYNACLADPACHAQMAVLGNNTASVVSNAVGYIPVAAPYSNPLGQLCGMLASVLGGIMYGKRLRKVRSNDK